VILAVRSLVKGYIALRITGRVLPTPHLLKWGILKDQGTAVEARRYRFFQGLSAGVVFPKFLNTTPEEISLYQDLQEDDATGFTRACPL
jgi:hypothetical protein